MIYLSIYQLSSISVSQSPISSISVSQSTISISHIGCFDGNVYERMMNEIEFGNNPLNQSPLPPMGQPYHNHKFPPHSSSSSYLSKNHNSYFSEDEISFLNLIKFGPQIIKDKNGRKLQLLPGKRWNGTSDDHQPTHNHHVNIRSRL